MLKKKTIIQIAVARGWGVSYDFIYAAENSGDVNKGAIYLGKQKQLIWKDARLRHHPNVHLNAYYPWPRTRKICLSMFQEIEDLIKTYI